MSRYPQFDTVSRNIRDAVFELSNGEDGFREKMLLQWWRDNYREGWIQNLDKLIEQSEALTTRLKAIRETING